MEYRQEMILLGAHFSIQGGLHKAVDRAHHLECSVLQLFTHNPRQWVCTPVKDEDPVLFREKRGALVIASHASYLINLVSANTDVCEKSLTLFIQELKRADTFDIPFLILHPGSSGGHDEATALTLFASALDSGIRESGNTRTRVLLETTAGHKGSIGYRFEHLRDIIGHSGLPGRLRICFDTCHVFSAGYDIRDEESYTRTMDTFDQVIGMKHLYFFHLNDALNPLGSRRDRHTHIGEGHIGAEGFRLIMCDKRFAGIGKCIETPKGDGDRWDRINLALLRRMATAVNGNKLAEKSQ
jgi:deoxyribonuclease IV